VYVETNGAFTISGGEISGNSAIWGGGVYVGTNGTLTMSGGTVSNNHGLSNQAGLSGGGVLVDRNGIFTMSGGEISGNSASRGGGVLVNSDGIFTMSGGEISGNMGDTGGGVYVDSDGIFTKQSGGVIYGSNAADTLKNTVSDDSYGYAVYVATNPVKRRNNTAGSGVTLSTSSCETGISGISYSSISGGEWTLLGDGRRRSPDIEIGSKTKARVSFTATADAEITILLQIASDSAYDYAFISPLDNGSATYSQYYRSISGSISATITMPVPDAGSHFVDIDYENGGGSSMTSSRVWFTVLE
jgi:hypothetical protein